MGSREKVENVKSLQRDRQTGDQKILSIQLKWAKKDFYIWNYSPIILLKMVLMYRNEHWMLKELTEERFSANWNAKNNSIWLTIYSVIMILNNNCWHSWPLQRWSDIKCYPSPHPTPTQVIFSTVTSRGYIPSFNNCCKFLPSKEEINRVRIF